MMTASAATDGATGTNGSSSAGPKKIAVIGAGVTGLLIAQGLMNRGFDVTVYERDPSIEFRANRPISFMIHWGFDCLKEILPEELWAKINSVFCNPADATDLEAPGLTFYHGHTGELLFRAPPTVMRRVTRQKLRSLASTGVDIRWSTTLESFEAPPEGEDGVVKLKFQDGFEATADVLIGADGPRSKIRHALLGPEKAALTQSDFVCGYSSALLGKEIAEKITEAHPIWTLTYHSKGVVATGSEDAVDPNDKSTWIFNITRIWRGESPPINGDDAIAVIKENTKDFCEPFRSAVQGIPAGSPCYVRTLYYWKTIEWPNHGGRVTLAGDSAHPMLPFRGQGINHATEDALRLIKGLTKAAAGEAKLKDVIDECDADVVKRGSAAVEAAVKEGTMVQDMEKLRQMTVLQRGVSK